MIERLNACKMDIEFLKSCYSTIAELFVSLDGEDKVIMKSRTEIDEFIKKQPVELQERIVDELLDVFNTGAISDSFLQNRAKDYFSKIQFAGYLKHKKNYYEGKRNIEINQSNERLINKIKIELELAYSKHEKVNYLLDCKRRLEGDYPFEIKNILAEDSLYIFINTELMHWERYNELPLIIEEKKTIPRLQTKLTTEQREQLFIELVKDEFILDEYHDCFNWVICANHEKETKPPVQWQPIDWKQGKQYLRELLEAIKSDDITKAKMEGITPALFTCKGKSFEALPKNKVEPERQYHRRLMKILATILNN